MRQPNRTSVYSSARSASSGKGRGRPFPSEGLLLFVDPSEVDSISLSVADYANVGADLQAAMYTDSTHPIVFDDFSALWDVLSILGNFNLENYMGTETKGIAIYEDDTSRAVLNRALRWFGLDQVEPAITEKYLNTGNYTDLENYA